MNNPIDCEQLYRDGRHYDLKDKDLIGGIPFCLCQIAKYGEPVLKLFVENEGLLFH